MALKIRLARGGAKKKPYYRIVVADVRSPRDGRFIERIGSYNPMLEHDNTDRVVLKEERIKHWLEVGAQPTDRVARILGGANILKMPERRADPEQSKPKAKAQERAREEAEAAAEAAQADMVSEGPATADQDAPVVEEAKAEEAPAEEAKAEEAPAEEAPAEEAKAEEAPAEEAKAEEAPAEEAKAEKDPAEEEKKED